VDAAASVRKARRRAGLTQRRLAELTGVAQPTIAKVERGSAVPRVDTLARLLAACGEEIQAVPKRGQGIDRTLIRELLRMSPAERLRLLTDDAAGLARLERARRR
jgi:transcriptional regulator with XRE-family HTH domain